MTSMVLHAYCIQHVEALKRLRRNYLNDAETIQSMIAGIPVCPSYYGARVP